MLSKAELINYSETDILNVPLDELKELTTISINPDSPIEERFELFINEIHNPYCFLVNGFPVKISFCDSNITLNESLYNHIKTKIDNDNIL